MLLGVSQLKSLTRDVSATFAKILMKQSVPDANLPHDEMPPVTVSYPDSTLRSHS